MNTLPRRESATQQAPIIDLHTRQPVTTAVSNRGGKRDPLPRITITIPNYGKYQTPTKGRREWVRLDCNSRHNRQLASLQMPYRWAWCVLLMIADQSGTIADVTVKDLAFECQTSDLRQIRKAVDAMAEVGLISVTDHAQAKHDQSTTKAQAKQEQSNIEANCFEQSSNDAALSATTVQDKDKTRQDITLADQGKPDPGSDVVSVIVSKDGQPFAITTAMVEAWQPHYPNTDVAAEVGRIAVWHAANPSKQKTMRGMTAFVVNWLSRSNDPTQLTIGGLTNGTNGRTHGNGKSLGQNMGVHRGSQPGGIYDIQM